MSNYGHYIGITIGPILKTILTANDTGQLWGSSYIYSNLMENLINEIKKENLIYNLYIPSIENIEEVNGVGIYPDRLIFTNEDDSVEKISNKLDKIIDKVIRILGKKINTNNELKKIIEFLKEYFQIHYAIEKDLNSPIIEMNKILDSLELNHNVLPNVNENYLVKQLSNRNLKKTTLMREAGLNEKWIKSVIDIAKSGDDKDQKYYAIVQSDGDNIGELVKKLENDYVNIKHFSTELNNYVKNAIKILKDYNAFTIYAGGDDLLFFAPLKSNGDNIFDLLDNLNKVFKREISANSKNEISLSFGLSITHSKYPLYEALKISQNLLFNEAKKFKLKGKKKNAIACQIIKYSGKSSKIIFNQNSITYRKFRNILKEKYDSDNKNIKSIKNDFRDGNIILSTLVNESRPIKYYFENKYNKEIHKKYYKYIYKTIEIVDAYASEYINENAIKLNRIYDILDIKDFIN